MNDRRRGTSRQGARARAPQRAGRQIGPIPVSASGIVILIALVGTLAYLAFALTVRDASQIPLLASGAVILGVVFTAVAAVSLRSIWQSSIGGRDGRAFGHAIVGGIAALIAAACFAGAFILGILATPPDADDTSAGPAAAGSTATLRGPAPIV